MFPEDKEAGCISYFFLLNRCSFVCNKEGKIMGEWDKTEKLTIAVQKSPPAPAKQAILYFHSPGSCRPEFLNKVC